MADDEDSLNAIADWLNSNGKDSTYELTAKDLQEIFKNDPSKLNDVVGKLGVNLTESDPEPDDEKKKEINKWLNKLNSLKDAEFDKLNDGLKEKVAQKFIDNEIDVNNDDDIKAKLAGFIKEVVVEKKESEISLKFDGNGKVTIVYGTKNAQTDFVFGEIKNLQGFVENLKDKEITKLRVNCLLFLRERMLKSVAMKLVLIILINLMISLNALRI